MPSACKMVTATVRVTTANTGRCFPSNATTAARPYKWLSVTAARGNAGTLYVFFNATTPARGVNMREQNMEQLTRGQTITYTGMGRGGAAPREIWFGTGRSYLLASATSQRAIITTMENV